MEKRCDTIEVKRAVDEPSSIVVNLLKPVKKVFCYREECLKLLSQPRSALYSLYRDCAC